MASKSLARYVEIKQQISELEKELEDLKDAVFNEVHAEEGIIDRDEFVIRSYQSPRYKFSDDYDRKNSELKDLRKEEIENGTAVVEGYSEFVKLIFKKGGD